MSHSVAPGALVVDSLVEQDRKAARVDEKFVRRLAAQLRTALTEEGGDGVPQFRDTFVRLDRSVTADNFAADIWRFKALLKGPTALSDKDLDLFFSELYSNTAARIDPDDEDVDEAGGAPSPQVDMAESIVYMRRAVGHPTAQFHTILRKIRAKRPAFDASPFNVEAAPSRLSVFEYLTAPPLKLTQSEAFWVLERSGGDAGGGGAGSLDTEYLVNAIFSFPLPDDIAYPLLLNKVVECVSDAHRTHGSNGISGLRRHLQRVLAGAHDSSAMLPPNASPLTGHSSTSPTSPIPEPKRRRQHGRFASEASPTPGEHGGVDTSASVPAPAVDGRLTKEQFRQLTLVFGAGLSATEADVLFEFIADADTHTVGAEDFVRLVSEQIPPLGRHELVRIAGDVRHAVVNHSFGGLCDLHVALTNAAPNTDAGDDLPLGAYTEVFRACGVTPSLVSDIELEHMHREAASSIAALLLLRGNLPSARESVIQKLFKRFDDAGTGLVLRDNVLTCFEPEAANAKICRGAAEHKECLVQYLRTLPANDPHLTLAEFMFFWGNVSASFNDDARFVMLLWQAFGMQRDGTKMMPQSASRRRAVEQHQHHHQHVSPVRHHHATMRPVNSPAQRVAPPAHHADDGESPAPAPVGSSPVPAPGSSAATSDVEFSRPAHPRRTAPVQMAVPMGDESDMRISRRGRVAK